MRRIRWDKRVVDPSTPAVPLLQHLEDVCFSASSFTIVVSMVSTLIAAISALFGMLMLSYRSRIQTAEKREEDANQDRDEAVRERNEALWRLDDTRAQYRDFAVETHAVTHPNGRRSRRLPNVGRE